MRLHGSCRDRSPRRLHGADPRIGCARDCAGADVVAFNPLSRVYPRWAPRRGDHRKILVVDGEVAFSGGLNIGDEYTRGVATGTGERRRWSDAHVRITGPAVQMLEAVFFESWIRADGRDRPWPNPTCFLRNRASWILLAKIFSVSDSILNRLSARATAIHSLKTP